MKRNTKAIVQLATEKSRQARLRVIAAITTMQAAGSSINFNTVGRAARVSKTFLYDPKHADLAEQIRSLRQVHAEPHRNTVGARKSDLTKEAQIARFKVRIKTLEERIQALQEENELLYGKLSENQSFRSHVRRKASQDAVRPEY